MDYRASIAAAVKNANASTRTLWDCQRADQLGQTLAQRFAQGPVDAEAAAVLMSAMPTYVTANTPAIPYLPKSTAPTDFMPQQQVGLESWYYSYSNFKTVSTDIAPERNSGVLVFVWQTQVLAPNVSAWAVFAGAVDPATQEWVQSPVIYLDADQVRISDDKSTFTASNAAVSITVGVTTGGFSIDLAFTYATEKTPFRYQLTTTSARGPTYEQSGNMTVTGPLQNAYWSIVDGVITKATLVLNDRTYESASGMAWLDYEQIGLNKAKLPKPFTLMGVLASAMRVPDATPWMFLAGQSTQLQFSATFSGSAWNELKAGRSGRGTANIWVKTNSSVAYALHADAYVTSFYPGTTVASAVYMTVTMLDGAQIKFSLRSVSKTQTLLYGMSTQGWESPSLGQADVDKVFAVDGVPSTFDISGVIEWFPNRSDDTATAITAQVPVKQITAMKAGSSLAVGYFASCAVLFALLVAALALISVYTPKCKKC